MNAILIGATGLIGRALLNELLSDDDYTQVTVVTRRTTGVDHTKLNEILLNFDEINTSSIVLKSDVLFSTLGTTLKTAGSKERQWEIDFDMQFNTAKIASECGTKKLVLLSSAGANAGAKVFYSRMKGELDEAVKSLGFSQISIIRPSMLTGNRKEFRWGEKIFTPIMYAFSWIPGVRKYRPIKDVVVAKAMMNAAKKQKDNYKVYELEAVFNLARSI